MKRPARQACGALAATAALAVSSSLQAQTPLPPTNAGRELEATKPPPTPAKPDTDVLPRTDTPARPAAGDTQTLLVKGFRITGNTVFTDDVLQEIVKPFVGQQLNSDQLLDVTDAIKDRYKAAGYFLTQVFIPPQTVPDGVVALTVIEAHVGKATAQVDSHRVRESQVQGYVGLLKPGDPVTEAAVERPLLLLKDLPGIEVGSTLAPGGQVGEADLNVTVKDVGRTLSGDAYVDNAGNIATGLVRVGADVQANGLLGFGEIWSLGGLLAEDGGVKLVRGLVTAPIGPYGTKLTASATDLHYDVIGTAFKALGADGYAYVASLLVQHPLERSRNANIQLVAGVDRKWVNDRQQSGATQDDRHLTVANLGATGDFRDGVLSGALNSYTLTFYLGNTQIVTPLAAQADLASNGGHATSGDFQHVNVDFERLQSVGDLTSLLLSVRAQEAFQNLDESEKASLGGPHGVRAYGVGEGAGDDVVQATFEIRRRVPGWTLFGAPFVGSFFVDVGHFKTWHDPLPGAADQGNEHTLSGYGIGVNMTHRDDFQLRCDISQKISSVPLQGSDKRDVHVWASLQKWF